MKTLLKFLLGLLLLLVLLGGGGFMWAKAKSSTLLGRTFETHSVDFPIPFPLDSAEIVASALTPEEAASLAAERALERGEHLMSSRYACTECHGEDLGGGVMVDDPMIGTLLGPNITAGEGGLTAAYTPADWDRIVRHGVKPDGHPSAMPSEDFQQMSDQELSDIIMVIRGRPDANGAVPGPVLRPLGTVLLATGEIVLSADVVGDHFGEHRTLPPATEASEEFGRHLAGTCTGCHRADLSGGPVQGGDPSWPPSSNLTPHAEGLAAWTMEHFVSAMREGRRPDGSELLEPMDAVVRYTSGMTDTELEALWAYLRSLPPVPTGG